MSVDKQTARIKFEEQENVNPNEMVSLYIKIHQNRKRPYSEWIHGSRGRRRPLPSNPFLPEGYEQHPNGMIVPVRPVGPEPRTIHEGIGLLNTIEITKEISEKNVLMWKKLFVLSAILLLIVNVCLGIFYPSPLGFLPIIPLFFTMHKWKRADARFHKQQREQIQQKIHEEINNLNDFEGRRTNTVLR